jgi:hypothetical protein
MIIEELPTANCPTKKRTRRVEREWMDGWTWRVSEEEVSDRSRERGRLNISQHACGAVNAFCLLTG